jgi:putative phage-type endonuclease
MMTVLSKIFAFPDAELVGDFVPGSPEWHEARKGSLGGSQIGAVLGLNPWESARTCFLKVTGQIPSDITPSMSMRLGTKLEAPILEIFQEEHPELQVFTTGTYRNIFNPWAHANPDAVGMTDNGELTIIEVKYSSEYWSEIPRHYVAQVNWYMWVTGVKRAIIVALCGSSYKEFVVEYDEFVIDSMLAQVKTFWLGVETGTPPDWDGSESTYQSMRELNKNLVDLEEDLGDLGMHLVLASSKVDEAQTHFNEMRSRVLDAMGDAKYGVVEGVRVCSRQQSSSGVPFLKIMKGKK